MMTIRSLSVLGLSTELIQASQMIPFAPPYWSREDCLKQIIDHIPNIEEALDLTDDFFQYATFMTAPVERTQIANEIIPAAYRSGKPVKYEDVSVTELPNLALFFAILASGYILSPKQNRASPSVQYDKFHHLARAALNVHGVFENGSVVTCQAFLLIGVCELHLGRGPMRETSWKIVGMSFTIGASVSLLICGKELDIYPLSDWST